MSLMLLNKKINCLCSSSGLRGVLVMKRVWVRVSGSELGNLFAQDEFNAFEQKN